MLVGGGEEETMTYTYKDFRSIVICERSRIGRRFLLSLFVKDSEAFLNVYDRISTDIEWCAVKLVLHKSKEEESGAESYEVLALDDCTVKKSSYMEIHMQPSAMAEKIMEEYHIQQLFVAEISDASERYSFIKDCNADLMLVVMEKDIETNILYKDWINELYFWSGCYKTALIYRTDWPYDTNNDQFTEEFQSSIIETISVNPRERGSLCVELNRFEIKEEDVVKLVKEMIESCQYVEPANLHYQKYDLDDFKKEKHDRVKTGDGSRVHDAVVKARRERLEQIFKVAQRYNEEHWPQEWQQLVIRFVFHTLSVYIRKNIGIGKGIHPAETQLPVTMYAMESMFAKELLREVVRGQGTEKQKSDKYIEVMRKNGVKNMIDVRIETISRDAILKMELTEEWTMDEIKPFYKDEIIGYHYIMSLQKLGEYHVWEELFYIYEMSKAIDNYVKKQMGIIKCRDCQYGPNDR